MPFKFNPFTGNFDVKGAGGGGGGSAFFAGEVPTYADLPLDGTAALDSRWLVRTNSGTWPFSSYKQAGVYVRTGTVGANRDDDYTLTDTSFHDVMSDDAFVLFDEGDATKNLKFQLSGLTTGTTRTLTVPDANITLDDAGDPRDPNAHAASHAASGSDPLAPSDIGAANASHTHDLDDLTRAGVAAGNIIIRNENNDGWDVIDGASWAGQNISAGDIDAAASNHTHELNALAATAITAGKILTADGDNTASWQDAPAGGDTVSIEASAADVLSVTSGAISADDAGSDKIVYWKDADSKLAYGSVADVGAAAASHDHTAADIDSQTATDGFVLTADGAGGAAFEALPASGISAVGTSTADVLSVSGSDLVADDGGTIDSSDPFIKWDDTAGKLVYANPLSRPSGAFYVGLAPTTTALGTNCVNIQSGRDNAAHLAKDASSVCVGYGARSIASLATTIGHNASCGNGAFAGGGTASAGNDSIAVGYAATSGNSGAALGRSANCSGGFNSVAIGNSISTTLRAQFSVAPFSAIYWGGQTTDATPLILNLDAAATNRFTIAASTALAVDILLVARRSDTQDKWLVARRFLGIRRDGSNNTSLIGSVQTLGTDQSDGSPSWSFTLTADDTNEALKLEVTGAASETVQWRATAFYRVV